MSIAIATVVLVVGFAAILLARGYPRREWRPDPARVPSDLGTLLFIKRLTGMSARPIGGTDPSWLIALDRAGRVRARFRSDQYGDELAEIAAKLAGASSIPVTYLGVVSAKEVQRAYPRALPITRRPWW